MAVYRKRGLALVRFTVVVMVLLQWAVIALDRGMEHHLIELWPALGMYGLALPMVTLYALLVFTAREGRYLFLLSPYIIALNGMGLSIMLQTYGAGDVSSGLPHTLILLNPVFALLLSGMLLRDSLPTAVFVFCFHLLLMLIIGYPLELLAGNMLVISGSVAMCLLGAWQVERWHRAAWLREREFQRMADRDQLTGLASRYYLFMHGQPLMHETLLDGRPVSVLMVDVDHFKEYNDRFGHTAGDRCLQRIAGVIRETVEEDTGIATRFGGEEFLVLLPDSGRDHALTEAESLRERVAALDLDGAGEGVSVSIGVATAVIASLGSQEPDLDGLIAQADDALYQAKRDGRNRVIPAEERAPEEPGLNEAMAQSP